MNIYDDVSASQGVLTSLSSSESSSLQELIAPHNLSNDYGDWGVYTDNTEGSPQKNLSPRGTYSVQIAGESFPVGYKSGKSGGFYSFGKGDPCPLCGSENDYCKEKNDIYYCSEHRASVPGFFYIGPTKNDGEWGMFKTSEQVEAESQATEEEKLLRKQRREATRKLEQQAWEARQAESLTAVERDRGYRLILSRLHLDPRDRENLLKREQLTLEEIKAHGFKSVTQWQPVAKDVPRNLPGVLPNGNLNTPEAGYLCPLFNRDGLIVACQVRARNPQADRRYYWLSSSGDKRPNGQSAHLKGTHENPLLFLGEFENAPVIGLCEGTGAKPLIAHKLLGIPIIGAASGNFANGESQILEVLKVAPEAKFVLLADAGSQVNPGITRHYQAIAGLLHDQGRVLEIADWGQWDSKTAGDVDERGSNIDMVLRPFADFAPLPSLDELKTRREHKGFGVNEKIAARKLYLQKRRDTFLTYWPDLKRDFSITRTPDLTYSGNCPTFALLAQTIGISGWLGAGKTESIIKSLVELAKSERIFYIAPLTSINRQFMTRAENAGVPVYYYQDDTGAIRSLIAHHAPGIFVMCPDSFNSEYSVVKEIDWSRRTISVVDEFNEIRSDILKKKNSYPEFKRMLSEVKHLIVADAFLSDADLAVLKPLRKGKGKPYIIAQKFTQSPKKITLLSSTTKDGLISLNHDGIFFDVLDGWVIENKRFVVMVDNLTMAIVIDAYLKEKGLTGVLLTGQTIETNRAVLHDPNNKDGLLAAAQYVVATPVIKSGSDIQIPFDVGLYVYTGVITPKGAMQHMGRFRQIHEWFVSVACRSLNPNAPPHLNKENIDRQKAEIEASMDELGALSLGTHAHAVWQDTTEQIEKSFHSEYFVELLNHFYASVTVSEGHKCRRSKLMEMRKKVKKEQAWKTFTANLENGQRLRKTKKAPITDAEYWDIELAIAYEKDPEASEFMIHGCKNFEALDPEEMAIHQDGILLILNKLMDKVEIYEQCYGAKATKALLEEDIQHLLDGIRSGGYTSYVSANYKKLQTLCFCAEIDLRELAQASPDSEGAKENVDHFYVGSSKIKELWEQFQKSDRLRKVFPLVKTIGDFWEVLKQAARKIGLQSTSKSIRVKTPGESHPNGKDANGNPCSVQTASIYCVGWIPMEQRSGWLPSGAKGMPPDAVRELKWRNFIWVCGVVQTRIERKRSTRQTYIERSYSLDAIAA